MNKWFMFLLATFSLTPLLLAPFASAEAGEKAKDNYRVYCIQCHGMQGDGMGLNIRDMSVQPRDHTDVKSMASRTDTELFKVIKEGGVAINKSSLMPPWGDTLSDDEIHDLVQYLRTLCKCKGANG
ncbi:MAG: cytochrome c [Mariprofundaceae bacterium]|nr:cytochrome c [Mariprofundaceae bacterium]